MSYQKSELVDIFWKNVPKKYLEQVLRSLFDSYEAAWEHCDNFFEPSEAVNVLPFLRRAFVEAQLRAVAQSFPEITATARRSPESAWNHTLITCGAVAFTESTVGTPDELVRPSLFRQQYSAPDNVRYLFPEMQPAVPTPDSVLYGVIIHGRSDKEGRTLGFAQIRFPTENLSGYQPGSIDLFLEFPEIVLARIQGSSGSNRDLERIPEPVVELRTDQQNAGGGA